MQHVAPVHQLLHDEERPGVVWVIVFVLADAVAGNDVPVGGGRVHPTNLYPLGHRRSTMAGCSQTQLSKQMQSTTPVLPDLPEAGQLSLGAPLGRTGAMSAGPK